MTTAIRAARASDAPRLTEIAIAAKSHWGYSKTFIEACRAELTVTARDVSRLTMAVAECDGTAVAFGAIEWLADNRAELDALFVDPAFIGHGIGRALTADLLAVAAARGVQSIEIQADPNAAGFYEAMGARRIGERVSASIPGRMLPLYEMDVSAPTGD